MPSVLRRLLGCFRRFNKSHWTKKKQVRNSIVRNESNGQVYSVDSLPFTATATLTEKLLPQDVSTEERQKFDGDVRRSPTEARGDYTCSAPDGHGERTSSEASTLNISAVDCGHDMTDSACTASKKFTVLHKYRRRKPPMNEVYIYEEAIETIEVDGNSDDMVERLGEMAVGSYARVYVGKHVPTLEIVAVKEISLSCALAFKREVDFLRQLQHDNIVAMRAVYGCTDRISIVMEFMTMDLFTVSNNTLESLGENMEMSIMHEVLQGLVYLHDQNIVHNDIKPENILIGTNGAMKVKIADFGLSFMSGNPYSGLSGTRPYIAPEVYHRVYMDDTTVHIGTPVDLWALGITMVILAKRSCLFQHLSVWQYDQKMMALEVFPLQEELVSKGVKRSQVWMDVVGGCLQVGIACRSSAQFLLHQPWLWNRTDLESLRPFVANALMALEPVQTHSSYRRI